MSAEQVKKDGEVFLRTQSGYLYHFGGIYNVLRMDSSEGVIIFRNPIGL